MGCFAKVALLGGGQATLGVLKAVHFKPNQPWLLHTPKQSNCGKGNPGQFGLKKNSAFKTTWVASPSPLPWESNCPHQTWIRGAQLTMKTNSCFTPWKPAVHRHHNNIASAPTPRLGEMPRVLPVQIHKMNHSGTSTWAVAVWDWPNRHVHVCHVPEHHPTVEHAECSCACPNRLVLSFMFSFHHSNCLWMATDGVTNSDSNVRKESCVLSVDRQGGIVPPKKAFVWHPPIVFKIDWLIKFVFSRQGHDNKKAAPKKRAVSSRGQFLVR